MILALSPAVGCVSGTADFNMAGTEVVEVEMSSASLTLKEGMTASLSAVVRPWNANETEVSWSSSDSGIAAVDDEGRITAVSVGEAVVSAECSGARGECSVTVISALVPAESLDIDTAPVVLKVGQEYLHHWSVSPEDCTDVPVWTSSDDSILSIDDSGKMTPKRPGQVVASIRAGECSASVRVLVYEGMKIVQTDALEKPVSFVDHAWNPDTVRVARGETATVQMVVYADGNAGTVVPTVSYFAPQGQTAGLSVEPEMFWLPDIRCSSKWDGWFGGAAPDRYPDREQYFPDPLIPVSDRTMSLASDGRIPVWTEFDIPHHLPARTYDGLFTVSGGSGCPFAVQVYDVDLPEKQTLDIMQWINSDISAMIGGAAPEMYDVYDKIENVILPLVTRYGQNSFNSQYAHRWLMSQSLKKNDKGEYYMECDFSSLGREIEMYLRACPDLHYVQFENQIASNGKKDEGILIILGYKLDENGEMIVKDNGNGTYSAEYTYYDQDGTYFKGAELYYSHFFHALQEYLRSHELPDGRTWLDIFLQTISDEPSDIHVPAYQRISSYIKKGAPDLKIMEPIGTLKIGEQYIDVPCPCIDKLEGEDGYPWGENQIRWIYSANGPQGDGINRFIRVPLMKTRMMHWLNYRYNATGYLHWGLTYWHGAKNEDPWLDACGWQIGGDCWIIWPGDGVVYPSIRLAAMRDGIRDFDLLKMYEKRDPDGAMRLCRSVAIDYLTHNTDIQNFRQVRREILETLEK